jgi:release factor glutamine methyltransferase
VTTSLPPGRDGDLGRAIAEAARRLAEAGIDSARTDAEVLAAHALGVPRRELAGRVALGAPVPAEYPDLVAERARRIPLQHLTGRAGFRGLDLLVGPGVFLPRPETEVVAGLAIEAAAAVTGHPPLVVDLCAGSGAIALSVAAEVPRARVVALEFARGAHAWAERNIAALSLGNRVELRLGDVAGAASQVDGAVLADLAGRVDVVAANPPYIPPGEDPVDEEVRAHDPRPALYGGGPDGLRVPGAVVATARDLLRVAGFLVMEHAESQGRAARALVATPDWRDAQTVPDLTGRDRALVVRRAGEPDDHRSARE